MTLPSFPPSHLSVSYQQGSSLLLGQKQSAKKVACCCRDKFKHHALHGSPGLAVWAGRLRKFPHFPGDWKSLGKWGNEKITISGSSHWINRKYLKCAKKATTYLISHAYEEKFTNFQSLCCCAGQIARTCILDYLDVV